MQCDCGQNMRLVFFTPKEDTYKFFWGCKDYPNCSFTKNYKPFEPRLDIAEKETMESIRILEDGDIETKTLLIDEIKVQMVDILNHFIDCTWGAHYMTLFNKMIVPYLDDPKVLQYVLKGSIINENKGNVYRGKSGTKMYPQLMYYLRDIKSQRIQEFLEDEFGSTF